MRALTRPVLMAIAAAALMVATSSELFASPIFFDFSGACHSVQGDGCAAFGLSDGSNVSGTFMFDDSVVLPNTRLILYPSSISFSFAFTFGNFAVTDADVRGSFGSPLEVFFLGPDATELNALSGFIPFQVLTDGSKYLLLQPFHRVEVDQVFAVTRDVADAEGSWIRRSPVSTVPEPSSGVLLLLGLVGTRVTRRLICRVHPD